MRLLSPTLARGAADRCVMGVLFATLRGHVFCAEFRAVFRGLRSFARRRSAGVPVEGLFWHRGTSANCRALPISGLNQRWEN